jgi:hypothetical protein
MVFRLITTFEKSGENVIETLWTVKSYYHLADCYIYEGNPYIEDIQERYTDDMSYAEYYVTYHDQNFYELWHDEFKDIYIPSREVAFDQLRKMGVEIKQYWEKIGVAGVDAHDSLIKDFVSRFPPEESPLRFKS